MTRAELGTIVIATRDLLWDISRRNLDRIYPDWYEWEDYLTHGSLQAREDILSGILQPEDLDLRIVNELHTSDFDRARFIEFYIQLKNHYTSKTVPPTEPRTSVPPFKTYEEWLAQIERLNAEHSSPILRAMLEKNEQERYFAYLDAVHNHYRAHGVTLGQDAVLA